MFKSNNDTDDTIKRGENAVYVRRLHITYKRTRLNRMYKSDRYDCLILLLHLTDGYEQLYDFGRCKEYEPDIPRLHKAYNSTYDTEQRREYGQYIPGLHIAYNSTYDTEQRDGDDRYIQWLQRAHRYDAYKGKSNKRQLFKLFRWSLDQHRY